MSEKHGVLTGFVAMALLLVSAWVAGSANTGMPQAPTAPRSPAPVIHEVATVEELETLFREFDYDWPLTPGTGVPLILLNRLPAGYDVVADVRYKQALFLRTVLPLVLVENRRLRERRALAALLWRHPVTAADRLWGGWANSIAERFGIDPEGRDRWRQRERLLSRLDELPVTLVLAQAAIESGWGTSRFAREGNSLFGQWTYDDNGLEPMARDEQATHRVRSFASLRASVRAYLHNINTGHAYRELRTLRARMRQANAPLDAYVLAGALWRYSARGEDYVADVRRILRSEVFEGLEAVSLRGG